jgi:transcriptional regulator with XRE-family HTH domain
MNAGAMKAQADALTSTLRGARRASRLSQLELSMRMGVSQRHVSYVESGRAKPSRELLRAWLHELNAPLALRNEAMLQAGYAPVYGDAPLGDPTLARQDEALTHLLDAHDPMPAFVMDSQWNILRANRGGRWLAAVLMPQVQSAPETEPDNRLHPQRQTPARPAAAAGAVREPLNMLDALCRPDGFVKHLLNLAEVGPELLARIRADATAQPALAPKVEAFAAVLRDALGKHSPTSLPLRAAPILTSRFATPHGELAFFGMFTTFGTPQDITLASLRVEHLFAADEATRAVLRAQVAHVAQGT